MWLLELGTPAAGAGVALAIGPGKLKKRVIWVFKTRVNRFVLGKRASS